MAKKKTPSKGNPFAANGKAPFGKGKTQPKKKK